MPTSSTLTFQLTMDPRHGHLTRMRVPDGVLMESGWGSETTTIAPGDTARTGRHSSETRAAI